MSGTATDYLTRQLSVENNIVTFVTLSDTLKIHVNLAKNELADFYENFSDASYNLYATYILIGTPSTPNHPDKFVASEQSLQNSLRVYLVGQDELEAAKQTFSSITSHHIYSLSCAPILDPEVLLYTPSTTKFDDQERLTNLNAIDKLNGVGRTSSESRVIKKSYSMEPTQIKPSLPKPIGKSSSHSEILSSTSVHDQHLFPKPKEHPIATARSGSKLNFVVQPRSRPTEKPVVETQTTPKATVKAEPQETVLEQSSVSKTQTSSLTKPKKEVGSDDEEDEQPVKKRVARRKTVQDEISSVEMNSLMDMDDALVSKISHYDEENIDTSHAYIEQPSAIKTDTEDPDHAESDDDEGGFIDQKARRNNKRSRKKAPLGSNGLPKKRVQKSRKEKNEKGYSKIVDYSSWESASEQEIAPSQDANEDANEAKPKPPHAVSLETKVPNPTKQKRQETSGSKQDIRGFFSGRGKK